MIYDNGPILNSPGTGVGGADESVVQTSTLNMTTLGYGHQFALEARLTDDFEVPPGALWRIDRVTFFGYQTGSTLDSTFTALNLRIWEGPPTGSHSRVVFGDTTSNRLLSTVWTGIYRVREDTSGVETDRPVMANQASVGVVLEPGHYWVDFQADGTLNSGPWCPPITLPGQAETGDGYQSDDGGVSFHPIYDGGSDRRQGLPFLLEGARIGVSPDVPALGWAGLAALAALLAVGGVTLLARRRVG
ncbi:MAG: hypothetical protein U0002_12885 [Thermoanaerobaculia bacterium]